LKHLYQHILIQYNIVKHEEYIIITKTCIKSAEIVLT